MQKFLQKFEGWFFYYFLFLVFFIPLYFKFPLVSVKGTFVSIRLEDILIGLGYFFLIFILVCKKGLGKFFRDRLVSAFAVYFIVALFSVFSAIYVTHTVLGNVALLHFARRAELMLLFPLTFFVVNSKQRFNKVLITLFSVLTLTNIYALGQKYLGFPAVSTTNAELSKGIIYYLGATDRVGSTFAGHYDLAVFLMMGAIVLFGCLLHFKKRLKVLPFWGVFLVSLFVLILTAARLSFFAFVAGIVFLLVITKRKREILVFVVAIALLMLYPSQLRDRFVSTIRVNIGQSWQGYLPTNQKQQDRSKLNISTLPDSNSREDFETGQASADIVPGEPTNTVDLGVYRSFDIRLKVEWPRAIRALYKNPFFGTGLSSLGLATDNDVLRSLGETGLLGFTSFLLIVVILLKRLWKLFVNLVGFEKYYLAGALAMVFAFLVNSMFIDVFEASKSASIFWIMVGTALSLEKKYE